MSNETVEIIGVVVAIVGAIVLAWRKGGALSEITTRFFIRLNQDKATVDKLEELFKRFPEPTKNRLRDIAEVVGIASRNTENLTDDQISQLLIKITDELPNTFEAQLEAKKRENDYDG